MTGSQVTAGKKYVACILIDNTGSAASHNVHGTGRHNINHFKFDGVAVLVMKCDRIAYITFICIRITLGNDYLSVTEFKAGRNNIHNTGLSDIHTRYSDSVNVYDIILTVNVIVFELGECSVIHIVVFGEIRRERT